MRGIIGHIVDSNRRDVVCVESLEGERGVDREVDMAGFNYPGSTSGIFCPVLNGYEEVVGVVMVSSTAVVYDKALAGLMQCMAVQMLPEIEQRIAQWKGDREMKFRDGYDLDLGVLQQEADGGGGGHPSGGRRHELGGEGDGAGGGAGADVDSFNEGSYDYEGVGANLDETVYSVGSSVAGDRGNSRGTSRGGRGGGGRGREGGGDLYGYSVEGIASMIEDEQQEVVSRIREKIELTVDMEGAKRVESGETGPWGGERLKTASPPRTRS